MRISDWSADVCSSDLADRAAVGEKRGERVDRGLIARHAIGRHDDGRVADIEIHIARRRDFAADLDAPGRGEVDDLDPTEGRGACVRVGVDTRVWMVIARRADRTGVVSGKGAPGRGAL